MSGSVNKVILVGNLGRDPEFTQTQDGRRFGRLSIATSERWRDRGSGERREQTEWHRVVIFNENSGGRCGAISAQRLQRSISKANCRHANGRISRAMTAIPLKWCWAGSVAS